MVDHRNDSGTERRANGPRLRVLISAFSCGPDRGSEPGNGWNWALQAARDHDVWIITTTEFKSEIESARDRWEPLGIRIQYHDLPYWPARFVDPVGRGIRVYYALWQRSVLSLARAMHREIRFDIIHHVTFNTVEMPGYLWRLDVFFVWGPVGGAQVPPREFRRYFGRRWFGEEIRILRKKLTPYSPTVRGAVARSKAILVANQDTAEMLRKCGAGEMIQQIDVGVSERETEHGAREPSNSTFVLLWAGVLVPRKGPLLALETLRLLRDRGFDVRLRMAGEGPMHAEILQRARAACLGEYVELPGRLSRAEMDRFFLEGDAFLFTSLHDTSGTVILEAMARGLPVVTVDHQGAAEMVDRASGIKVPVTNPAETVASLADGVVRLIESPELRRSLGESGRARVRREFVWERKADLLSKIYVAAVEDRSAASIESELVWGRDG